MATLEQVIATCLMTPRHDPRDAACVWGLPLNIVGLSGGGKSERIAQACAAVGLPLFVVFPASKQPEDFGGAPFMSADGIIIECILPQANKLRDLGQGVLAIDELSTARPAVQASALGLVNDRRVGDHLLPPRVRVVTAMNPTEYAAGGFTLEAPLANRMMHVTYDMPTVSEWTDWLTGQPQHHLESVVNAEQKILAGWDEHWSQLRGLMVGFMESNQSQLHQQPKPDDPDASGPWRSPRMWHWAGRGIAASRCLGMPGDIENKLIAGCVGEGVLPEWIEWVSKADLPHPRDMLQKNWMPDTQRLDITMAALTSMSMWVCDMKDLQAQQQYAIPAWGLVDRVFDAGLADVAMKPASALLGKNLGHTSPNPSLKQAAREVILKLGRSGYAKFAGLIQ